MTREDMTFDDIEEGLATPPPPPDLATVRLDGDNVPEPLRGKSVQDALEYTNRLTELLRESERARSAAPAPAPTAPPAAPEPEELTPEKFNDLFQQDPYEAYKAMQASTLRQVERNLGARLDPLRQGVITSAEAMARSKYAEEFSVLGDEIKAVAAQLPDKSVLANPAAWDQIVTYARGAHFDKLVNHRLTAQAGQNATAAQAAQRGAAPVNIQSRSAPMGGPPAGDIDPLKAEIAKTLGMSIAEYQKWERTNG